MRVVFAFALLACLSGCGRAVEFESVANNAGPSGREDAPVKEHCSGQWTPGLTDEEKETLFDIATDTLDWCVNKRPGPFLFDKYTITDKMKEDTATFVTLKIRGMLRGCIGSLMPVAPLHKSVHDNAINASMRDHRFRQVSSSELEQIDVHISVLSPIGPIDSVDEFMIGEHGIILEKGMYRAVYLPEVAVEQGWTKEETLTSLSRKAGMSGDAWRSGTKFKVFSSVVLSR